MIVIYKSQLYIGILYVLHAVFLYINRVSLFSNHLMALLPITVQVAVLISIFTKYRYVKLFIKGWSLIFIVGSGLRLLSQILYLMSSSDKVNYDTILETVLLTTMGILIYVYCDKTIIVEKGNPDIDKNE